MTTPSRVQWVQNLKKDTQHLLKEAASEGRARASETKDRASAVKRWLSEGEKERLENFGTDFSAIQKNVAGIKRDALNVLKDAHGFMKRVAKENKDAAQEVRAFLGASEKERLAAFRTMMKEVGTVLENIVAAVRVLQENERHERMLAGTVTTKKHPKMRKGKKKEG